MAIIKTSTYKKCWRGCREKGTLLHCWWKWKLVQPLWRTVWRFLKKLEIELPSVQFSHSVVSDSLWPHESHHARPPCPSPTPGDYSNSCPLSQWCHLAISSSCHPLLFLPPIPPSIRVFSNESYDPAIPLLGIHTEETRIERDTCTPMFIEALFIIARTWKQPRCPSADEW